MDMKYAKVAVNPEAANYAAGSCGQASIVPITRAFSAHSFLLVSRLLRKHIRGRE